MDHGGEVVPVGVAVAASVDESDLGVDAFQAGVGQAEFDGGDDGVEVFADAPDQVLVGGDAAAQRRGAPGFEVGAGVGGVGGAVEVAQSFLELTGPLPSSSSVS